jgi:iron complex outermembrane receptor protein
MPYIFPMLERIENQTERIMRVNVKPEKLNDFELGWRYWLRKYNSIPMYYMAYKDQLILTGNLDDVGAPIRSNSEKSYRLDWK